LYDIAKELNAQPGPELLFTNTKDAYMRVTLARAYVWAQSRPLAQQCSFVLHRQIGTF